MWTFALTCLVMLGIGQCSYSSTSTSTGGGYAGSSAGSGAGSFGGGYSGVGYGGGGGGGGYGGTYGGAFPFVPIPSFDNRFGGVGSPGHVTDFLQNLQNQHAASLSMTSTQDGGSAYASSTLAKDKLFQQQLNHQASVANNIEDRFGPESAGSTGGSGSNFAAASASYGPGGGHQSVYISPPNPSVPNIHTRFDSSGSPGTAGISTSSFSSSSDVNGVQTNRRGAVTSVNDNGKVTTYYTHS